ncbi:MAG: acyl-CoA dehydrogenase family protein [Chloroflexota bacterium]|nr:acyl-CoA dehydrogenase family protein [Chloroflexota bacterium]
MSGLSFTLTEEQRMLQEMAHDFAVKEIIPVAEHYDRTSEFPWPLVEQAQAVGLMNTNVPMEYGGAGLNVLEEAIVAEELSYGCSGIATALAVNNLAAIPIMLAGSGEQKREWLGKMTDGAMAAYAVTEPGAGSNVVGMRAMARREDDRYVLNGSKTFISNASVADFFVVFAKTDKEAGHRGISAFIVPRDAEGFSVSKHFDKLGQRASDTAEISLDEVAIPAENRLGEEGQGFYIAMGVFDYSRPTVGSGALGVARRAFDEARKYAAEREAFGQPIVEFQAIGHKLADMAMNIDAARLLVWRAAHQIDSGQPNSMWSSMAKAFAADMAMQATVDAVQIFGGYGYMKEYPVEKLMRDVKIYQIYEGTSQIQRNIIVREMYR